MCITKEEYEENRKQAHSLLSELKKREKTLDLEKKQIDARTWIYVEKGKASKKRGKPKTPDLILNDFVLLDDNQRLYEGDNIY